MKLYNKGASFERRIIHDLIEMGALIAIRGAGSKSSGDVWRITTKPFKEAHFATFPPDLPERCITAGCPENGTVLDPFAGSGTTLMVALKLNRSAVGIEIKKEYCDLIYKRCEPYIKQSHLIKP